MTLERFRLVVRHAYILHRSVAPKWLSVLALAAFAFFAVMVIGYFGILKGDLALGIREFSLMLLIMASSVWNSFATAIIRLNTPAHDHLVPGARRMAIEAIAILWLVCVPLLGGVFGFAFGDYLFMISLVGIGSAGGILASAACYEGFIPYFGAFLYFFAPALRPYWSGLIAHQALLFALTLCFGAYAYWRLFSRNDKRWARQDRISKLNVRQSGGAVMVERRALGPMRLAYDAVLAHDCKKAGSIGNLAFHTFGAKAHWSANLIITGVVLFAGLNLGVLAHVRGWGMDIRSSLLFTTAFMTVLMVHIWQEVVFSSAIKSSTTELGLVRLTARLPQGQAFNQLIAKRLLAHVAGNVVQLALLIGVGALLFGRSNEALVMTLSAVAPLLLINGSLLSRLFNPAFADKTWPAFSMLLQVGLVYAAYFGVNAIVPLPWWMLAVASIGITLYLLSQDWRALVAGPAVFPLQPQKRTN